MIKTYSNPKGLRAYCLLEFARLNSENIFLIQWALRFTDVDRASYVRETFTSNFPNLENKLIPKEGFLGIFKVSLLESTIFGAVISID